MNSSPRRPLSLDGLRAFEAVARRLSFSAAADELFVTQSAVSRQIKALEQALGAPLFLRGARRVEITSAGETLRQAVLPANVSTFASFVTLWLMPRLAGFQQQHPDIDIRITATDVLVDLDDPETDVALRYDLASNLPAGAERMFGDLLTPVASPWLMQQATSGRASPLATPADLAQHALLEEDDARPSSAGLGWRRWLALHGQPTLEPRRWIYLNYTHQQVQGALAGQGVALARMALVHEHLVRGELVEPFGPTGRMGGSAAYWLLPLPGARLRPELRAFIAWLQGEAAATRSALGNAVAAPPTPSPSPSSISAAAGTAPRHARHASD